MGMESVFKLSVVLGMIDQLTPKLPNVESGVSGTLRNINNGFGVMQKAGAAMAGTGAAMLGTTAKLVTSTFQTQDALGELASLGVEDLAAVEKAAKSFSDQWAGTSKADFITASYDIKSGIASLSDEGVAKFTELAALTGKATKSTTEEMGSLFATGYGIYKNYYSELSDLEFGEMFSAGIASAVRMYKTSGSQMASSISMLGATATNANVPMEEQLAILGQLQTTMSGSEAATKYKAFLNAAAGAGEKLGLTFTDANNQLLSTPEILTTLKGKYGDTIDAVEKQQLKEAFRTDEAVAMIDLLYNNVETLDSGIQDLQGSMQKGTAVTNQMAEAINNTPAQKFEVMKQQLHNNAEALAGSLLPSVNNVLDKVNKLISTGSDWIANNQDTVDSIMQIVVKVGVFLAVAGVLLTVIGTVGKIMTSGAAAIGTVRKAFSLLSASFMASPVTLVIVGIVAIIAVFRKLYSSSETFRSIWDSISAYLPQVVQMGLQVVLNLVQSLISALPDIISTGTQILHIVALRDNPADGYEWSSASIDSQFYANGAEGAVSGFQRSTGFSYGYGLIEIKARCKTPSEGVWPAFWSRGASQQSEGWPMCGEIDIGELFYSSDESSHRFNPGVFWYDWHYLAQKSQHATNDGLSTGTAIYKNVDTNWHYYGMERSEAEMIFYFDRKEFCRISLTTLESSDILSAMRQPMSVKLNLAMGSTGGDIPEDLERAEYDIDYVRYYAPASVTESTDSGTWGFPDYMPTELAPNKIARIIPDRDMTDGKNQYLYWESSDESIATATAGLIRTVSGASGEVTITMHDTFGNSKSANITVKEDANCVSTEVREIPTNPNILPYGETSEIQVRLVPYWVTKHTVTAELNPVVEGVIVSVAQSSHAIAKYTTPCSIISIENNSMNVEDTNVDLVVTAEDSGVQLTMPITLKCGLAEFDTTGMYAAYLYENTVESSSGVGTINDATGNNKDALTNLYYTTSYNNGICRVPGKGIQSQVQNGQFNPSTAEGFFLEEFNPDESRTFVFNIMAGMTEMRSAYNNNQAILSIVHSGIGRYGASNTTDGRHGASFGYVYSGTAEDSYFNMVNCYSGNTTNGLNLSGLFNPENGINPEVDNTGYPHGENFIHTIVAHYNAEDKSIGIFDIADGAILSAAYNGMSYANTETQYNNGNWTTMNTVISDDILAEAETNPFYWRYGNGNQICSDFVRAICVYDRVLSKDEMLDVSERLSDHYV